MGRTSSAPIILPSVCLWNIDLYQSCITPSKCWRREFKHLLCTPLIGRVHQDYKPQAVHALKRIAGLCQASVAHHHLGSPDTGSNSGGRQMRLPSCSPICHACYSDNFMSNFWGLKMRVPCKGFQINVSNLLSKLSFKKKFEREAR